MEKGHKKFDRFKPHPWHGVETGSRAPEWVNVYVEITPYDQIKYELDPTYGFLRVDRPQRTASLPPTLYGLVPQTICGDEVAALSEGASEGDEDALDICVLSEHEIRHPEVLLCARVVGGIHTTDGGKADEKIVAVLENDCAWGGVEDIDAVPKFVLDRLVQYFGAYKEELGSGNPVKVSGVYGAKEALEIVEASVRDYRKAYGD